LRDRLARSRQAAAEGNPTGVDAYKPSEMARRVQLTGVAKARLAFVPARYSQSSWPITAFVALGFEHSVANMFLLPLGIAAGAESPLQQFVTELSVVTLAVVGGAGGVAIAYWACCLRNTRSDP
jgi:hypothetical protein